MALHESSARTHDQDTLANILDPNIDTILIADAIIFQTSITSTEKMLLDQPRVTSLPSKTPVLSERLSLVCCQNRYLFPENIDKFRYPGSVHHLGMTSINTD